MPTAIIKSPCKGCDKRHLNCHSQCKDYAEYKHKIKAVRVEENKIAEENNFIFAERKALRAIRRGRK